MSKWAKLRQRILSGEANANIRFSELVNYLKRLGFEERVKGSHHIFTREGVPEQMVLHSHGEGNARPYQVRQVRGILEKYGLGAGDD